MQNRGRHGVNKVDTATDYQSYKWKEHWETWKEVGLGSGGLTGAEKIMVVDGR